MGTLTSFNADNGTDGASCTPANLPAINVTVGGSGAITFSSSAAMTSGALGYRFVAQSAATCRFEVAGTSSKTQMFRGTFRPVATPSSTRNIMAFRGSAGLVACVALDSGSRLLLRDVTNATIATGPTLTPGASYDVSVALTVGASTDDGRATLKVYNAASQTQIGSTVSGGAFNLGTVAAQWLRFGPDDANAGACEFYWDTLRFENDRTTEFPPHTALTYFDAENGVDGATITASSFPASTVTLSASSAFTYSSSAAMYGRLGYYVLSGSAQATPFATVFFPNPSKLLSYRFNFRPITPGTAAKAIIKFRDSAGAIATSVYLNANSTVGFAPSSGGSFSTSALTPGADYEFRGTFAVGTPAASGAFTAKVFNKATGQQHGVTLSSSAYAAGNAGLPIGRVFIGCNEAANGDAEYAFDSLAFADQADELPGSIPASGSVMITSDLVSSAVKVPKITNGLLRLT